MPKTDQSCYEGGKYEVSLTWCSYDMQSVHTCAQKCLLTTWNCAAADLNLSYKNA